MAKNPNQLAENYLHINSGHTPTQEELDDEVREMFRNRPEGLNYIYDTYPKGEERTNALNRLNRVYPETRNLRERWNDYIDFGIGDGERPEMWNDEIIDIEKQLPFKDQAEHDLWLNRGSAWKGEPEWLDQTEELLTRAGYQKPQEPKPTFKSKLPF